MHLSFQGIFQLRNARLQFFDFRPFIRKAALDQFFQALAGFFQRNGVLIARLLGQFLQNDGILAQHGLALRLRHFHFLLFRIQRLHVLIQQADRVQRFLALLQKRDFRLRPFIELLHAHVRQFAFQIFQRVRGLAVFAFNVAQGVSGFLILRAQQ